MDRLTVFLLRYYAWHRVSSHKVNYFHLFPVLRPGPGSPDATEDVPPHGYGGRGHLPSGCSAPAAPGGLDKGRRTTGPVLGNAPIHFPLGRSRHNSARPSPCKHIYISVPG